jgi:hypothetical protein
LNLLLDPNQYTTAIAEMRQRPQTFQQASAMMKVSQPLGSLPLIVLTAGQASAPGEIIKAVHDTLEKIRK